MQLSPYIKDLLYRYECVIIPGFGAFLANYTSATIDADSSTFYPPGKTISFNRQLQTNDGLLANYVASVEGTSYELALQKIRNFTDDECDKHIKEAFNLWNERNKTDFKLDLSLITNNGYKIIYNTQTQKNNYKLVNCNINDLKIIRSIS